MIVIMTEIYNQKYFHARNGFWRLMRKWFLFPKVFKLTNPEEKDIILEIGCERGDFVRTLSPYSQKVIGIDINKEIIEKTGSKNLIYMSAEKLEFPPSSFDKIVSCHTIEHLPDLKKVFSEIERVLKSGGKCILVYPLELIRGFSALRDAWLAFRNPFLASKIHLHRLWPNKLKKFTQMKIIKKGILFSPSLDFYTILQKE